MALSQETRTILLQLQEYQNEDALKTHLTCVQAFKEMRDKYGGLPLAPESAMEFMEKNMEKSIIICFGQCSSRIDAILNESESVKDEPVKIMDRFADLDIMTDD